MKAKWVDVTTYSRAESRGTILPRSWECRAGGESIVVTRRVNQDGWYMDFIITGITKLDATEIEQAKEEAVRRVSRIVEGILDDLR